MRVLIQNGTDPGVNLALEEVLLESSALGDGCCWLWRDDPAVILGRNQVFEDEVNVPYAREQGIPVYRRKTGGGAVYHDGGVLNFSFIVPAEHPAGECLDDFLSVLNLPTLRTERNDVLWRRRKIIGTAQRLAGRLRLFHGSLLYAADLERLSRVLTPPAEKLLRHGVGSVRSRVGNCGPINGMTTDRFRFLLTERLAARFDVDEESFAENLLSAARQRCIAPLPYDGKDCVV